tara:strand:+ start:1992 stop:3059 length:1068 start_codon:yes stop_codon:yes gene_type:complete
MAYTTIDNPELYFQAKTFAGTGTGGSTTAVTLDGSEDMAPDLVWVVHRNASGNWKGIANTVRGVDKGIHSNTNAIEADSDEYLTAFGSDGFTVGENGSWGANNVNYVAYCWKAGTTSGITTNGSTNVTPSGYSFDQTGKFSVLTYSGNGNTDNQVAHGIGTKPDFMIVKNITGSVNSYAVFHKSLGNEKYLEFDVTNTVADNANRWQDTDPDTVNFTTGNSDTVNNSSYNYLCFAWAEVKGFSKFGSYTGNVNADGKFIWLGFKPAFFMVKETGNAEPWVIYDNKRSDSGGPNPNDNHVTAEGTAAESSGTAIDFLSNGVKLRSNAGHLNEGSYVYMAWAEAPFVNSNGVPCTAY